MQTIISIIGLAVGFTCFSLATLWMRYENTYDSFHKSAKNLYVATMPDTFFEGITYSLPSIVPENLKEIFPEVKESVGFFVTSDPAKIGEQKVSLRRMMTNSTFMTMFNIKVLEGSLDFTNPSQIAITKAKAKTLFGEESPIGKKLSFRDEECTITAVVSGYSNHSNFAFDILGHNSQNRGVCMLELHPNVNVEAFKQKLHEHKVAYERMSEHWEEATNISLIPITKFRTEYPANWREIKFQHIKLFAWSGILVILCALFNYLTLFVSRFKIRGKELALRVVCGASLWSLFCLLLAEFLITLLAALLLGLMITTYISPAFQKLSAIQMSMGSIYVEMILYILLIILLTILLFAFTLVVFRKYALNASIRKSNNQLFRKISIVVQLVISIGFVFCTTIMIKQVRYLHNTTDIGFEYKNRACLSIGWFDSHKADVDALSDKMKQIPEITDIVVGYEPLLPSRSYMKTKTKDKDGNDVEVRTTYISKEFVDFYGLQLIVGEFGSGALINESAMISSGWHKDEAVGKQFGGSTVKGVIKNIYNGLPTVEVVPMVYYYMSPMGSAIIFKYTDRKIVEAKINELRTDFPDISNYDYAEDSYERFFKTEKTLIMMLNIMSAVCVLISVFGFFSLVSLSCEEKRKEIAIRKVNGADIHDIVAIFFKEYSLLLAIGAIIAFPIGYYIMKNWLDQYINKTSIDSWIYAAILLAFATIIVICVGWRVYKTSRENPADVVKSE